MRSIRQSLVIGVCMDGGNETFLDSKTIIKHFGDGGETVHALRFYLVKILYTNLLFTGFWITAIFFISEYIRM
jgi:hypothetical protein